MAGTRLNMPNGLDNDDTAITVYAEAGLPTAPFYCTFESGETVKVTVGGPTVEQWTITRGEFSTSPVAHKNGEKLIVSIAGEIAHALALAGASIPGMTSDNSDGVITIGNVRAASFYQSAFSTQTIYDTVVAPRVGSGPAAGTYKYFIALGNALGPSNFINGYGVIAVDGSHSVTADFDPAEVIGSDVSHIYLYRGLRNAAGGPFYLADSMAYPSLNSTTFVLNQLLDTSTDASIVANPLYPAYDQSLAHSIIGPIDVQGAVGEFGASAPSTQAVITGTLTSATLAQLTSIVSQVLVALDAKGTIRKNTS